ncbi:3-beta hydroxysteroid dehydrogenase [Nocardioides sp. dk4132]|uniref:SDR family oxidoreductase n=1 Tax=unclassified Nocardioides TaxID=2615069 RepID=UPI0012962001|nr:MULTISPECIES: 3-beta hydroxysteroid dehydrogenase [unclassified Nocardioides]MQW78151.1 3-beta hydroxysteroid dehydrogenase [Nocardioides sp. dk4132]QGA06204.1 3-beta hydroxysteroid dehydrogenase [Nocardioides sp. dk884]
MLIAVAGSTGVVGRHVVEVAGERGHQVVELARAHGVDLTTGAGLAARLDGAGAVVDVTSVRTQRRSQAEAFFGAVTRTLLDAEQAAGVGHHVALSIVGVDDVASGYYQGKQLQERLVTAAPVGWSLLRATQFHEFAEQVLGFAPLGPISLVPQMLSQPVAAVEVAQALVDLVEAGPSGRVPDLAGPERLSMVDLARRVSQARGLGRRVVGVPVPGAGGRAMRSGVLCPTGDGPRGTTTFADWLAGS